ncbi:hypothetical protein DV532_26490 (plasmid) [Pseudomonas sp. Leaf58]|uniref:hypothetical protein n=1 Tax=Pseudomonas sp. Leaf58 TaxID=1736226 RepID=UPI0006F621D1|nr:hypothetical protein [Pseudomonas sp. Leaf58]AYG47835.1 hypothetical protein DV532_26490 [Pseudomonas sp. Leaf58]KQN62599.1 hypothetical protein ASF02_10660 [Pseudomonas sp. Leaf58]
MKICMVDLAQSHNLVGSALGRLVGMKIRELCNAPAVALSFERATRVDATFMREAVVRTVMVFSPSTAVVVTGIDNPDHRDNLLYPCLQLERPITVMKGRSFECLGPALSPPLAKAVELVLARKSLTSVELANALQCSVQSASTNLKNLHNKGYINRVRRGAASGGDEYVYEPFGANLKFESHHQAVDLAL